jgi:aryl-alcohol dehydrogenase-like predicted oxidoreductase
METVQLGQTGVEVSRIGFGGAPAGLTNYLRHYNPDEKQRTKPIVKALHRAIELGITYFETAYAYGEGASEHIFSV